MFATGEVRKGRVLADKTLIPRDTLCVRSVGRTSPRLPFALRGWETAPRTAIWVHFQLFCYKFLIGPLARNREDWAAIGWAGPGLCSAYVTAVPSRDLLAAMLDWTTAQALQTNETQWENLLTNIALTPTQTTQFTAKVSEGDKVGSGISGKVSSLENILIYPEYWCVESRAHSVLVN